MRKWSLILFAALLVSLLSCRKEIVQRDDAPWNESPRFEVRLYIPDAVMTKAETDAEAALAEERKVTMLQIWIFRAGATTPAGLLGYRLLDRDVLEAMGVQNGNIARFTLPVTKEIAEEKPNVDVYAVLNGASVGLTEDRFPGISGDWSKMDPDDLDAFVFGGDFFGVTTLTTAVPEAGLPMAGVMKNQAVTGAFPILNLATLTLTRAVSKLHFVFTQLSDGASPVDQFSIEGISLGGQIGASEKLFTTQTLAGGALFDADGYVTLAKSYPTDGALPAALAMTTRPGYFLFDEEAGMTAEQYRERIQEGINSGELTEWNRCYLRESDKKLSGSITYRIGQGAGSVVKTAEFEMDAAGDFARNHSWTIYAYFIGGQLVIKPTVLPWIAGHDRLAYSTMGSTDMKYERPWLRYDLDRKSWTWDDAYVAIAYGYKGGIPTRSPRITFETINQNDLLLQLNNAHFRLVRVTHGTDGEGNPTDIFTQLAPGASLLIPGSPEKQTTEVYVVPENDNPMSDPYVKLMLTELHPGNIPPENLPFNHNLPGDEDHSSIRYYNPGAQEWDDNKDKHKVSGDQQNDVYWLEEEI